MKSTKILSHKNLLPYGIFTKILPVLLKPTIVEAAKGERSIRVLYSTTWNSTKYSNRTVIKKPAHQVPARAMGAKIVRR